MDQKFKIGDIVTLKSGGPAMTIVDDKKGADLKLGWVFNGIYQTAWFEGNKKFDGYFPEDSLKLD